MTPPGWTSKARPVGATRIAPPSRSQEEEMVGTHRSAPLAEERRKPPPPRARVESVTEEGSAPRAPAMEETCVPKPARAGDEGVVAAATAQTAPENVELVVKLPPSSDEFGDSRDIDPTAAASAADRIAQFASASEEVLSAGTSEGPHHGAIIQSGVPLEFLRSEQEEEAAWKAQFEVGSQIQGHLERALDLHRTTDLQVSQVGASLLGIIRIWS